jgi:hypothetical protein
MLVALSQHSTAFVQQVAAVCSVHALSHTAAAISLQQEENIQPNKTTATSATTTATTAASAAAADTSAVKHASSGGAVSNVRNAIKLQPVKFRYLDLEDVQGASKLKLHTEMAIVQDGVCSKWAVVQMLPKTNQCLLVVRATT